MYYLFLYFRSSGSIYWYWSSIGSTTSTAVVQFFATGFLFPGMAYGRTWLDISVRPTRHGQDITPTAVLNLASGMPYGTY